jgi:RNA polymerase sigma-70 factor (ECF subfamily)
MSEPRPSPIPSEPAAPPPSDAEAAFEAMVEEHYARLGAFACRLVGSRAAAEDVVHEVLLRIWRRRGGFSFHDPLSYLYQAVRNEAQSWHRREARERQRIVGSVGLETSVDRQSDALEVMEGKELADLVEAAVAELPPRRREIFRMQREQKLTYAEIAALLGISIKTVEAQMGQALKAIRRRLGPFLLIALSLIV